MIVKNYSEYGCFDYPNECKELSGFHIGEVVYDEYGDVGIILALYNDGEVRVDSNGMTCIEKLKKCPDNVACKEIKRRKKIRTLVQRCMA